MQKFVPFIFIVLLSSCSLAQTPEPVAIPHEEKTLSSSPQIVSGEEGSGSVHEMDVNHLSPGIQKMIEIQKTQGETGILSADCKKIIDKSGRDFCISQQQKLNETIKNTITWEGSIKKGGLYISTMDCSTIYSEVGQKYCKEYQASIKK